LTAGTRRKGASNQGPFKHVAPRRSAGPAGTGAYAEETSWDFGEPQGFAGPYGFEEPQGFTEPRGLVETQGLLAETQGFEELQGPEEPRSKRYTGRHAGSRGKATRKLRVGRVVPVAAVAATLAAGTAAAYGLGVGGHPRPTQLNAAMASLPASLSATHNASANSAASGLIKVATASGSSAAHAAAKAAVKATPSRKPAATPTAAATHAAPPSTPATTQAAAPVASASASTKTASTLSCSLSYGMLPDNVTAIVSFLLANGYSDNAAAGIAGNMYQESKGDPESVGDGGGGLIGFTPLPSGYVTGNPTVDLQTQLNAVLTYNQGWASYLPALNAAASPADAASIYVTDFERAGIPAAATREASATNVASACGI